MVLKEVKTVVIYANIYASDKAVILKRLMTVIMNHILLTYFVSKVSLAVLVVSNYNLELMAKEDGSAK